MIVDAYKSFNRVFSPSRADIESYLKILDRNGDGKGDITRLIGPMQQVSNFQNLIPSFIMPFFIII